MQNNFELRKGLKGMLGRMGSPEERGISKVTWRVGQLGLHLPLSPPWQADTWPGSSTGDGMGMAEPLPAPSLMCVKLGAGAQARGLSELGERAGYIRGAGRSSAVKGDGPSELLSPRPFHAHLPSHPTPGPFSFRR